MIADDKSAAVFLDNLEFSPIAKLQSITKPCENAAETANPPTKNVYWRVATINAAPFAETETWDRCTGISQLTREDRIMRKAYFVAAITAVVIAGLVYLTPASARVSLSALQETIAALSARVDALEKDNLLLKGENQTLKNRLACVSTTSDAVDLYFEGCNVHVRNGVGQTESINGRGNLIVGYDRARLLNSDKTGSHNLVVGDNHNYIRFGGLVAGFNNTISGDWASVSGGRLNTSLGIAASVSGGRGNSAIGDHGSVSGGEINSARGVGSSISGGAGNHAGGSRASVSGGENRDADGPEDWRAGGLFQDF